MRKEVLFAIIIGLILGGVIIFGLQLANKSSQQASSTTATPTPITNQTNPTPTPNQTDQNLIISSPSNNSVVNTPTIKIIGKSFKNSPVAIYTNSDEQLVTSGADGNFSTDLSLGGGENLIKITSQNDSTSASTEIIVIYTTAKID